MTDLRSYTSNQKRNLSSLNECAKFCSTLGFFSGGVFSISLLLNPFNLAPFQPPLFTFDMPPNKARPLIKTYCSPHIKDSIGKKLWGKLLITLISFMSWSQQKDRGLDIFCKSYTLHQWCVSNILSYCPIYGFVCNISKGFWGWILGCAWKAVWRFSTLSQFSSAFVLVWFVEHVVYGEGLYFLEFDELQIKQDQMNGLVSGGYTCAELWFSVSVNLNVRTHTHRDHTRMYEYIDSLFYRHSSCCLSLKKHTTKALLLTRPSYHSRAGYILWR